MAPAEEGAEQETVPLAALNLEQGSWPPPRLPWCPRLGQCMHIPSQEGGPVSLGAAQARQLLGLQIQVSMAGLWAGGIPTGRVHLQA